MSLEMNLAEVLAHSVMWESMIEHEREAPGVARDWARNDFTPDAPPPRNVGQETRETLKAQVDLAPDMYRSEAQFRPQYAQLERKILSDALTGGDGGVSLLDLYSGRIAPGLQAAANAAQGSQRAADVGDVERYGARAVRAIREADPRSQNLLEEINRQALSELQLGATLDPSLRREVQQSVRAGQAARGFGFGPSDLQEEALFTGLKADQLRRERQQFATGVAGLNAATSQDPFLAVLGRPSQAAGLGAGLLQGGAASAAGAKPGLFDPFHPYAADVYNTNFNALAAREIAGANNTAGVAGAALEAL